MMTDRHLEREMDGVKSVSILWLLIGAVNLVNLSRVYRQFFCF